MKNSQVVSCSYFYQNAKYNTSNLVDPTKCTLFLLPGKGDAGIMPYYELAKAVKPYLDFNIVALESSDQAMFIRSQPTDDPEYNVKPAQKLQDIQFENIVKEYADAIMAIQDDNFHLLGWSSGGLKAAGVAWELLKRNKSVAYCGLIDSTAPAHLASMSIEKLRQEIIKDLKSLQDMYQIDLPLEILEKCLKEIRTTNQIQDAIYKAYRRLAMFGLSNSTLDEHPARSIAVHNIILRNMEELLALLKNPFANKAIYTPLHFYKVCPSTLSALEISKLGSQIEKEWKNTAIFGTKCIPVVGTNHFSILKLPEVKELAKQIGESIPLTFDPNLVASAKVISGLASVAQSVHQMSPQSRADVASTLKKTDLFAPLLELFRRKSQDEKSPDDKRRSCVEMQVAEEANNQRKSVVMTDTEETNNTNNRKSVVMADAEDEIFGDNKYTLWQLQDPPPLSPPGSQITEPDGSPPNKSPSDSHEKLPGLPLPNQPPEEEDRNVFFGQLLGGFSSH